MTAIVLFRFLESSAGEPISITTLSQLIKKGLGKEIMTQPIFNYDEVSDTLYVSFAPGEEATGIELPPISCYDSTNRSGKRLGSPFWRTLYSPRRQR